MRKALFLTAFLASALLSAKELTPEEAVRMLFSPGNPFFEETQIDYRIAKEEETVALSAFDTRLKMRYEEKEYPLSTAEFQSAGVIQALSNGLELSVGYRRALGVQEYDNVKTGDEGEMIATLSLPLNEMLHGTSARETAYRIQELKTLDAQSASRLRGLHLYRRGMEAFYRYAYFRALYELRREVVKTAEQRVGFVKRRIEEGVFAPLDAVRSEMELNRRKRSLYAAKEEAQKSGLELAKLLNLSYQELQSRYTIRFPHTSHRDLPDLQKSLELAKNLRPEWRQISARREQLRKSLKLNATKALPKVQVRLSGVHDLAYGRDGYKVGTELTFPLQRRAYEGERRVLNQRLLRLENLAKRLEKRIQTRLGAILQSLDLRRKAMKLLEKEVELQKRLARAERIRYEEGAGDLEELNRQERDLLQIREKYLGERLRMHLLRLDLEVEIGSPPIAFSH